MNVTVFCVEGTWLVSLNRPDLGLIINQKTEKDRAVRLGKRVAEFLQCELKVA
jgi:hypothetical protein